MPRQVKDRAGKGPVILLNTPRKAPGGDSEMSDSKGARGLTPTRSQVGEGSVLTPKGSACSVDCQAQHARLQLMKSWSH